MTTFYDRIFKVPVWVQIKNGNTDIGEQLKADGADQIDWPSKTFINTVKQLHKRGWGHMDKPYPFIVSLDFLSLAAGEHKRTAFGQERNPIARPNRTYSQSLDRNVTCDADYERIFNAIMYLEDTAVLSYLFNIGDRCHVNTKKSKVFFTYDSSENIILSRLAENVIVVDGAGETPEEKEKMIEDLYQKIGSLIGTN